MIHAEGNKLNASEVLYTSITQGTELNVQIPKKAFNTKHSREYKYITYQQALDNFSKSSLVNENVGYFLDEKDKKTKEFINAVEKEISKCISNGVIESRKLRGRKARSFTAWILLKENKGELRIDGSFLTEFCKASEIKVTAVTLLTSAEEKRGIRVSQDENKVRFYEILNGYYTIKFNWQINNRDCSITVNISDNGKVTYNDPSEGLTYNDLEENKAVKIKIGTGNEIGLKELVSLDKSLSQSSYEELVVKPATNLTDISQGALKELARS